jgi:hypothetical protein
MPDVLPALEDECFFIAPIGSDGSPERMRSDGVLKFIVDRAAKELGLTAVRADQIADPGQITLQIIDHILGARAVVADVTGLNPNVFYELAVRHTAHLPVVIVAEKGCALPFDIAQMRTIFFESTDLLSADQAYTDIVKQLRRALEGNAVESPIAASVDVRSLSSGSAVERNIVQLIQMVEEVIKSQREIMLRLSRMDEPSVHGSSVLSGFDRGAFIELISSWSSLRDIVMSGEDRALRDLLANTELPLKYIAQKNRIPVPRPRTPLFGSETESEKQAPGTAPDLA